MSITTILRVAALVANFTGVILIAMIYPLITIVTFLYSKLYSRQRKEQLAVHDAVRWGCWGAELASRSEPLCKFGRKHWRQLRPWSVHKTPMINCLFSVYLVTLYLCPFLIPLVLVTSCIEC
jgi:hypothetical protein